MFNCFIGGPGRNLFAEDMIVPFTNTMAVTMEREGGRGGEGRGKKEVAHNLGEKNFEYWRNKTCAKNFVFLVRDL